MKTASPLLSRTFLSVTLGILLLSPCQIACSAKTDPSPQPVVQDRFTLMDTNKDGKIDLEEFKVAFPSMNEQAFVIMDQNKDNGIDQTEWVEFINNHGKGMTAPDKAPQMNNIPGDPLIPPIDSSDLPLMRPSN